MRTTTNRFILSNSVFAWIALATCLALLIPLLAMQFTDAVNWSTEDFVAMGLLVFGMGSVFVLTARKVSRKYWPALGIACVMAFVYLWAELAVGIFTHLGS